MQIRAETLADHAAIAALTTAAFAQAEHSDGTEAKIIAGLRNDGDLALSLVAEQASEIIGHVAFSPVLIDCVDHRWFGLGPVSVHPDFQQQGIGSALIHEGLILLRDRGAQGCVVLGDPAYYPRFGFAHTPGLFYDGAPSEYFMTLRLSPPPSSGPLPKGRVTYAAAFGS